METVFRTSSGLVIRTVLKLRDDEDDTKPKLEELRKQRRKIKEKVRRLKNPKKFIERNRTWRARTTYDPISYQREWRKRNPEKLSAQYQRYLENHREERKAYMRWYYENVRKPKRERLQP